MENKRTRIAVTLVGMFIFANLYHMTLVWFETNTLQSPIVFRKPYRDRFVSPVPSGVIVTPLVSPKKAVVTPKVTLTPTPKKKAQINGADKDYVVAKIREVFGKDGDVAVAVALAENTSMQPDRWSYSGCCVGIFQIHTVHIAKFGGRSMTDVDANIEVAHEIYMAQGWSPWEAFTNGSYLKFL